MTLKVKNDKVPYAMRAGKDWVTGNMPLSDAEFVIKHGFKVEDTDSRIGKMERAVDNTFFFALDKCKKSKKKGKSDV